MTIFEALERGLPVIDHRMAKNILDNRRMAKNINFNLVFQNDPLFQSSQRSNLKP